MKSLTSQQKEYAIVAKLIPTATRIVTRAKLDGKNPHGTDVREALKDFAVDHSIPYNSILISRALNVATGRTKGEKHG
jgi:hypothetical protein